MIAKQKLRKYCTNFEDIENYSEAVKSTERYDLHHRKEIETIDDGTTVLRSMKELKDLDLYWHRPPEELIFLRRSEHMSLHTSGTNSPRYGKKYSAETRAKISSALKGRRLSKESRSKLSAARKGKFVGDKSPMFGRTGEKSPNWKGDQASDHAKYCRLRKQKRRELANCSSSLSTF